LPKGREKRKAAGKEKSGRKREKRQEKRKAAGKEWQRQERRRQEAGNSAISSVNSVNSVCNFNLRFFSEICGQELCAQFNLRFFNEICGPNSAHNLICEICENLWP
jgi:hypothetical protein